MSIEQLRLNIQELIRITAKELELPDNQSLNTQHALAGLISSLNSADLTLKVARQDFERKLKQ